MKTTYFKQLLLFACIFMWTLTAIGQTVTVKGDLMEWHKVTLEISGPQSSETGTPNPFTDYSVHAKFTKGGESVTIPGYFAADGNAANSGATSGNKWHVHFRPPSTGTWNYEVYFRSGTNVRFDDAITTAGSAVTPANGSTGNFSITTTNKDPKGKDLRGKGRLEYVDDHFLRYAGNGQWSIKVGPDAPENFLAYEDFDNTPNLGGGYRKNWQPHVVDWEEGDPTWGGSKGKGIIGAINYLSNKGMNVFSFLTMNINGDDKNVFPYINQNNFKQLDVSKLAQWEILFDHAEQKGLQLHFKTQETENETLIDGGNLENDRKLYYLELIARFGHHLALIWDLGEENGSEFNAGKTYQNDAQRKAMAQYFHDKDPFRQNLVIHSAPGQLDKIYNPLLGSNSKLTGMAIQARWDQVHALSVTWRAKSANAGKKWVIGNDEQGSASIGVPEDDFEGSPNKDNIRHQTLWGTLMAGGAGVEYYFGYERPHSDLTCQDLRSRDKSWDYCRHALNFFNQYIPFWEMTNMDGITSTGNSYGLGKAGQVYVAYLPTGGTITVDLQAGKSYNVDWYNPRNGGALQAGNRNVTGSNDANIGAAPDNNDWVALIRATDFTHHGNVASVIEDEDDVVIVTPQPSSNIWEEKDGYVVIDMESNPEYDQRNWTLKTGYSHKGEGYLEFTGANSMQSANPANTLTFTVKINNPGEYEFRWHTKQQSNAPTFDAWNDSWVNIHADRFFGYPNDNNDTKHDLHGATKVWTQSKAEPNFIWECKAEYHNSGTKYNSKRLGAIFDKAGEYVIEISGRSQGHIVDRFILAKTSQLSSAMAQVEESKSSAGDGCSKLTINASSFPTTQVTGFSPAYYDTQQNALAINAAQHKDKYAAVKGQFTGNDGIYTVKINTLRELDGESTYKVSIGGKLVGTYQNEETNTDYSPGSVQWPSITVKNGDIIQVEFNSHTNGKIPEGGGTAYSRGRWTSLEFIQCEGDNSIPTFGETIEVSKQIIELAVGNSESVSAEVKPTNAVNNAVSWSSSNEAVATVDDEGKITAIAAGSTIVKVALSDNASVNAVVLVEVSAIPPTQGIPGAPESDLFTYRFDQITPIFADSEDTEKADGLKEKTTDGDLTTFWHTQWFSAQPGLPHEIHWDMGHVVPLDELEYFPRQDIWGPNGAIGEYEIYVSNDPNNWGSAVVTSKFSWLTHGDTATWVEDDFRALYKEPKKVALPENTSGRYIRLKALTEAQMEERNKFKKFSNIAEMFFRVDIESFVLSQSHINLTAGGTASLTATVTPSIPSNFFPIQWSSANPEVATYENGIVTAHAAGATKITATANDGEYIASCIVAVDQAANFFVIDQGDQTLKIGQSRELSVLSDAEKTVTWSSNNASVTIDPSTGVLTANSLGTAIITASADAGTTTATITVEVVTPSILFDKTVTDLEVGESYEIIYTISPSDEPVTWRTDNGQVAIVKNGLVVATGAGSTTIFGTLSDGVTSKTLDVTVTQPGVSIITEGKNLSAGEEVQLEATTTPNGASVTWSVESEAVSVSSTGLVKGLKSGTATVVASIEDGKYKAYWFTKVTSPEISLSQSTKSMLIGESYKVTAQTAPGEYTVSWKSNNEAIATVDQQGNILAKSAGVATITASILEEEYSAEIVVTVTSPSISITEPTNPVMVGNQISIAFNVYPVNETITWTSSDESVATVTNSVLVAKGKGTTTITASIMDGDYSDSFVLNVDQITSVSDLSAGEIVLFPNPARNSLSIDSKKELTSISLYSTDGQLVKSQTKNIHQVDISNLHAGVYFAHIILADGQVIISKIIKE